MVTVYRIKKGIICIVAKLMLSAVHLYSHLSCLRTRCKMC